MGTYFHTDKNDGLYLAGIYFTDSPLKYWVLLQKSQSCLAMGEFAKITFFMGTNFHEFCPKQRSLGKLIPMKINTNKVVIFLCQHVTW